MQRQGRYLIVEAISMGTIGLAQRMEVVLLDGKKGAGLDQVWLGLELEELCYDVDLLLLRIR